jgi:hypothetical protein
MRLGHDPHPDWPGTVRILIESGAATGGIVLSPDDAKPPSPEVASVLRSYGVLDLESGRPADAAAHRTLGVIRPLR